MAEIELRGVEKRWGPVKAVVAGFLGSPAMNLMEGTIAGGVFEAANVRIPGLDAANGPVTLGFRAEDAGLAATGEVGAPAYSVELLGDATLVSVRAGGALVAVKSSKETRVHIGEGVGVRIDPSICHLFDATTGVRLPGHNRRTKA